MLSATNKPVASAPAGTDMMRDSSLVSTLYAHTKLFTCIPLSSPINKVRSFSENLMLSGLPILSACAVLPSASGVAKSSPTIKALVSAATHSLLIGLPEWSFCPLLRFSAITPPALTALSKAMPLPSCQPLPPLTMESLM